MKLSLEPVGGRMLNSKQTILKPLLESVSGVHLTAYLVNRGDLTDLKDQLRIVINEAYEWLISAMGAEERNRFLEPLDALMLDANIFIKMKGNIGLFRTRDSFRVLNVPVPVERSCQVATTFHVKPLLRWLQMDRDFLLLGVNSDSAHLYLGSQDSFKLIDSMLFPIARTKKGRKEETFAWLNDWIANVTENSKPKLFIAGDSSSTKEILSQLAYRNLVRGSVFDAFGPNKISEICKSIRTVLRDESQASIEATLAEFRFAEAGKRTRKNIFQIARAVVQGKVRKLIVSDEISIFGTIDLKSGGLAIHPFDLNHEDDDILDDLAQIVLSQGGEVVVAKRNEIPNGRPILAILDGPEESLEIIEDHQYQVLQERFG
jgi:hypothetical protein